MTDETAGCVQLWRGVGDEAEEPLEALQPEEHQPPGEGLPEPRCREEGGGLGQTGVQHRGQRSPAQVETIELKSSFSDFFYSLNVL